MMERSIDTPICFGTNHQKPSWTDTAYPLHIGMLYTATDSAELGQTSVNVNGSNYYQTREHILDIVKNRFNGLQRMIPQSINNILYSNNMKDLCFFARGNYPVLEATEMFIYHVFSKACGLVTQRLIVV